MSLNLASLAPPISLRPSVTLTDEELMRFSEDNKPYKIERSRHGEIIIMTPVGGVGSTHEAYVASSLSPLERDRRNRHCLRIKRRLQSAQTAPASLPTPPGSPALDGRRSPPRSRPDTHLSVPTSSSRYARKATSAAPSKTRCSSGSTTARS